MIGYIFSTESNEIVCEIHGIDNPDIEEKATELSFLGCDEYGLTYSRGVMAFCDGHDYQETPAYKALY